MKEKVAYKKMLRCTDQTQVNGPSSLKTKLNVSGAGRQQILDIGYLMLKGPRV
jgi:hypothetical protein